ncbi:adenylyltransferase/cytidyltransferase family protein [Patescibacteria group bacterium]|nr:adenylyltransferase/cytidyltransferase family protein [Patescibacteria group bacterium]
MGLVVSSNEIMIKDLDIKILLSLSYTDQFKYPLTKEEIFLRIIGQTSSYTLKQVEGELLKMVSLGKIFVRKGYFFLKGSGKHIGTRLKRKQYSQKKWLEVEEFSNVIKHISWIKGILVTGSLAVNNVIENDDIDFMIVVQENRLWITRVLVSLFTFLKGKKRSWNGRYSNTWCLNLWLDDKSLELPKRLRNIYGAFEICQAVWVYDKGNTRSKFFELNNWAIKFLPNYFSFQREVGLTEKGSLKEDHDSLFAFFLKSLNTFLFYLQYLYMKPHMTSEKVKKNFAFFHPRDTKKQILGRWLRNYKKIIAHSIQATSPSNLPDFILQTIKNSREESECLVLATGVFDALHIEHLNFLKKAKKLGDVLIIGIESDLRAKEMKGLERPINSQELRVENLLNLHLTNNVFVLPDNFSKSEDHLRLVKTIMPNYLAVSSHTAHLNKKRKIMDAVCGEIAIIHQHNPKVSSTKIINGKSL